jgi:hypothetical protein
VIAAVHESSRSGLLLYRKGELAKRLGPTFNEWGSIPLALRFSESVVHLVSRSLELLATDKEPSLTSGNPKETF